MEDVSIAKVLAAFALVVALIGVMGWLLRRFGTPGMLAKRGGGAARLRLVEQCYLDPKRRLVLIRRDNVEHLVLLAPDSQVVIESQIAIEPQMAVESAAASGHSDAESSTPCSSANISRSA